MLAWIESWRVAGPELELMRREKIRKADTTRSILNLDDAFRSAILQQKLNDSSGLVEQQKMFRLLLPQPLQH